MPEDVNLEQILVECGRSVLADIHNDIILSLKHTPEYVSQLVKDWPGARLLDLANELRASYLIKEGLASRNIQCEVIGEERLKRNIPPIPDLTTYDGLVCLLDMVDGTNLAVRNLSHWCSAMIFYTCRHFEILAALVCDSIGQIYAASCSQRASVQLTPDGRSWFATPSAIASLDEAHVCFYGQKFYRLQQVAGVQEFERRDIRLYNFGGHPMLIKVADGSMDAVFELNGQAAHDAAAGLFIASRAGAQAVKPDGGELDWAAALLYPKEKNLRYVAAATPVLSEELQKILRRVVPHE